MRSVIREGSRSRVPAFGLRYADAPAAAPFIAPGGGEWPLARARRPVLCDGRARACG